MAFISKKNIFLTLLSRFGIVISGLAVSVLTARFLGVVGRGQYYYVMTLVAVIAQVAALGLQNSNAYFSASKPEFLNKLIVNSLWISLVFCGCVALTEVARECWLSANFNQCNWLIMILAPVYLIYLLSVSLMSGIGKISLLNYSQILMNLLTVLAIVISGIYTDDLRIMLICIFLAWIISCVFGLYFLLDKSEEINFTFHYDVFKEGFGYSLKAYLISISVLLFSRVSLFFLQNLSLPEELGYFSIAAQIGDALVLLPNTFGLLLFPHLVKMKEANVEMALKAIKKVGALMLVLTVFVGVTAPVFVKLFFGVEFMPAVKLIRYLLPGVFCYGLTIIFMQQLSARGIPMLLLWIWFVGLFVNVILSYILIPTYYAVGAAVASSLSYGIALILCGGLFYFSSKRS